MTTETRTPYRIKGYWLETCNCDAGCNCNFGGFPDHGSCQGLIGIALQEGNYGNVDMAGVRAVVAAKWPKAIHDGDGKAVFFVDDSASSEQAESLANIFSGKDGGLPWEIFATTLTSVEGPVIKSIEMHLDGRNSSFRIEGILEATMSPLKNPVTGEENEVHIIFPKGGLIWNDGDSATTSTMRIDYGDIKFDHPGQNGIFAQIEWTNQ